MKIGFNGVGKYWLYRGLRKVLVQRFTYLSTVVVDTCWTNVATLGPCPLLLILEWLNTGLHTVRRSEYLLRIFLENGSFRPAAS